MKLRCKKKQSELATLRNLIFQWTIIQNKKMCWQLGYSHNSSLRLRRVKNVSIQSMWPRSIWYPRTFVWFNKDAGSTKAISSSIGSFAMTHLLLYPHNWLVQPLGGWLVWWQNCQKNIRGRSIVWKKIVHSHGLHSTDYRMTAPQWNSNDRT